MTDAAAGEEDVNGSVVCGSDAEEMKFKYVRGIYCKIQGEKTLHRTVTLMVQILQCNSLINVLEVLGQNICTERYLPSPLVSGNYNYLIQCTSRVTPQARSCLSCGRSTRAAGRRKPDSR